MAEYLFEFIIKIHPIKCVKTEWNHLVIKSIKHSMTIIFVATKLTGSRRFKRKNTDLFLQILVLEVIFERYLDLVSWSGALCYLYQLIQTTQSFKILPQMGFRQNKKQHSIDYKQFYQCSQKAEKHDN